ncbi:MAG: tRNA (adenosine(37)-N6)-dimethylallyltransferase MiaA, partial [Bacillota bacterium]
VYRDLDIGTAKPTLAEQKLVKHHLIDLVNPDQNYSAADYQKDADQVIMHLWQQGKIPFMVGGTGLYIKTVTDRFAFGEKGADQNLRNNFIKQYEQEGQEQLYQKLKTVDPEAAARIHPNDRKRMIRALEVYALEGKPISEQVSKTRINNSPYRLFYYGLNMDRNKLYTRIERRVDQMIEEGFLEEVRNIIAKGYTLSCPGMQILGYRQLAEYLQGNISFESAVVEIKKQTRNLAKRQLTWFRREKAIKWYEINNQLSFSDIAENIYCEVKEIST